MSVDPRDPDYGTEPSCCEVAYEDGMKAGAAKALEPFREMLREHRHALEDALGTSVECSCEFCEIGEALLDESFDGRGEGEGE